MLGYVFRVSLDRGIGHVLGLNFPVAMLQCGRASLGAESAIQAL